MRTLQFDGRNWGYDWWRGQRLKGTSEKPLSYDLETVAMPPARPLKEGETLADVPVHPLAVPKPTLGMVTDGDSLFLIHPGRFRQFHEAHRDQVLCLHNAQFDFWCLQKHTDPLTQKILWDQAAKDLWRDTLILDLLLQLATGDYRHAKGRGGLDEKLYPANLAVLAEEWSAGELDKTDEYRLRFGEFEGLTEEQIYAHPEAEGFFSYALKDVLAVHKIYPQQRERGLHWMRKAGWKADPKLKRFEIRPDAVQKFGVLSEYIQVKASIALAELSRTPILVDQDRRAQMEQEARDRYQSALDTLLRTDPELIKRYKSEKKGKAIKRTTHSRLPQFDQKRLVAILEGEAKRLNCDVFKSDGKLKGTSTSAKSWVVLADRSEFIAAWVQLEKDAKLLEFLTALDAPAVYSRYNLLMRTGRTSAGAYKSGGKLLVPSLNIQQIPREDPDRPDRSVRSLFKAPPGHKWFACDYGYIEVRTLAAICRARYGWSKLADVTEDHTLRGGLDPHQKMACTLLGVTEDEYKKLPKDVQKKSRQNAKPAVFGYPGGLGIDTFRLFAKASYGVSFTKAEAKEVKKAFLKTYPEMELYLGDQLDAALEWNTGAKPPKLSWLQKMRLSDFLRGDAKPKGAELEMIWELLEWAAWKTGDAETIEDAEQRKVTERIRRLVNYRACVLTGRLRNRTTFTTSSNTPFQSAAADGIKLATFELLRRGYKLLNMVHDELGVAIPRRSVEQQAKVVREVMEKSMEYVLGQGVPVRAEGNVADYWAKG